MERENMTFADPHATLVRINSTTGEDGYFDLCIKDFDLGITVNLRLSPEKFADLMSSRVARGYGGIKFSPNMRGKL